MDNSDAKLDLIIEMLQTICNNSREISFTRIQEFNKQFEELKKQEGDNVV